MKGLCAFALKLFYFGNKSATKLFSSFNSFSVAAIAVQADFS
jgi:hypothetical protein